MGCMSRTFGAAAKERRVHQPLASGARSEHFEPSGMVRVPALLSPQDPPGEGQG